MKAPAPKAYLAAISPYVGGKSKSASGAPVIKLSSNENPFGCSPKALAAYNATAATLFRYPEDGCASLREAIYSHTGFATDQLICGAGSDDIIRMIIHAYAGAGDEVLFPEHAFLMYRIYTQQSGATPVTAPEKNLTTDVDALLAAVTPRTRVMFVANPNNPTGSYISSSEIYRLREHLRDDMILVLDGAYAEYMDAPDYTDGAELVATTNTLITRTFSKVYGLPALRVGWGYAPKPIIDAMYKVRGPFNVSQPAINAAIAALSDQEFIAQCVQQNAQQREVLSAAFSAMGFHVYPSFGNFMLIECGDKAPAINQYLLSQNIIIREVANYGLPHALRISVGTADENAALIAAMKNYFEV